MLLLATMLVLKAKCVPLIQRKQGQLLREPIWFLNTKSLVQKNPQGGIVQKEAPIHLSNLSLIDAKSGAATRVGYEVRDGKKVRVSRKSNEVI